MNNRDKFTNRKRNWYYVFLAIMISLSFFVGLFGIFLAVVVFFSGFYWCLPQDERLMKNAPAEVGSFWVLLLVVGIMITIAVNTSDNNSYFNSRNDRAIEHTINKICGFDFDGKYRCK